MEKLDLHEFLRIYIPGLYVASMVAFIWQSTLSAGVIVIAAVFIGLLVAPLVTPWHRAYFRRITAQPRPWIGTTPMTYHDQLQIVLREKHPAQEHSPGALSRKDLPVFCTAHYASNYTSPSLYMFRLPKTFGVLYFTLMVASLGLTAACMIDGLLHPSAIRFGEAAALACAAPIFYVCARTQFVHSLRSELHYWLGLPAAAMPDRRYLKAVIEQEAL